MADPNDPAPPPGPAAPDPAAADLPSAGAVVALTAVALLSLGVVMVSSAGMHVGSPDDPAVTFRSVLTSRSTIFMAAALAALALFAHLPARKIASPTGPVAPRLPLLLPLAVGLLLLVYVPGIGEARNGAHRWIALPAGFTVQPSEFAKWALIPVLAWWCHTRRAVMDRFLPGLLPPLLALGLVVVLIVKEDLGTGVLVGAAGCLVLVAGGARLWHFVFLSPIALLGALGAVASSPYRLERIRAFIDPFADPDDSGYHVIQSLVAIANGGGAGRGLGFGLQKFGYLPEDTTDFLFAIVCEELGLAGAALVLALYAALLLALHHVVRRTDHTFLKLSALGVFATIGGQALMNLVVVTGLAPTKGIALPLMSSGGTGWILTAAALGAVIAVDKHNRRDDHKPAPVSEPDPAPARAQAVPQ